MIILIRRPVEKIPAKYGFIAIPTPCEDQGKYQSSAVSQQAPLYISSRAPHVMMSMKNVKIRKRLAVMVAGVDQSRWQNVGMLTLLLLDYCD